MLFEDTVMKFWNVTGNSVLSSHSAFYGISVHEQKTKNFDTYKAEIEKTKAYIKGKREAFYRNNNLKER